MARPKRIPGEADTTERLRAAAEEAFAVHGFAGTRLEDIARRAGLTRPSLLHHYPSKDALYEAVVRAAFARLRGELVEGMAAAGPFPARLDAAVGAFVDHFHSQPALVRLLNRELLDQKGPGVQILREQVIPLLDLAVSFVERLGGDFVPKDLDVRGAVLTLVGAAILHEVSGPLRPLLFGHDASREPHASPRERFQHLARRLFLLRPEGPTGSTTPRPRQEGTVRKKPTRPRSSSTPVPRRKKS